MAEGDTGAMIGNLIGLGIGVAIAKKLTDDIKNTPRKKIKIKKEGAKNWIANETGGWD